MVSPYLLRPLRSLPEVRRQRDSPPPAFAAAEGVGADNRSRGADPAGDGTPGTDMRPTLGRPAYEMRPSSFPPGRG